MAHKRLTLSLVLAGSLGLMACDQFVERDCGVFDHPDRARWLANTSAEAVKFGAEDGTTRDFLRTAAVFNEPFVQSDPGSRPSDVGCLLSAVSTLIPADTDFGIRTEFYQFETVALESKDERLQIATFLEKPATPNFNGYILPFEGNLSMLDRNTDEAISYAESEEINGRIYESVVTLKILDQYTPGSDAPPRSSELLSELTYANTYGVIAYPEKEGRRFVLIPE